MKLSEILTIYSLLNKTNINEIKSGSNKYLLLKLFRTFKSFNDEFESFKKDTTERVVGNKAKFEEMSAKASEDSEAKKYVDKLNSDYSSIILKELESNKDVIFDKISKDLFMEIIETNKFTLEELDFIENKLVQK